MRADALDRLVVLRAGTAWDGTRLSEQHVAEHLSRIVPVLYVDPPMSWRTARLDPRLAAARSEPPLRLVADGIWRLTPHTPPGRNRLLTAPVVDALVRRAITRAVRALAPATVEALVTVPDRPVFGSAGERRRVHWVKDDYAAGAELVRQHAARRRRGQRRMARQADVVVVASEVLAATWRRHHPDVVVMAPGCDVDRFDLDRVDEIPHDRRTGVPLPSPVAGFVGTLSPRIAPGLLERVADAGHSLLLVGATQRGLDPAWLDALVARPNVAWLGPVPYAQLPGVYANIDVSLVPYADTAFNRASFPLKVLEGLAAGRRVVSTDLPGVRGLATDLVTTTRSPEEFVAAVGTALCTPVGVAERERRRAFARGHSWQRRSRVLAQALGLAPVGLVAP